MSGCTSSPPPDPYIAVLLLLLLLTRYLVVGLEAGTVLQSFSVAPPLGDGRVRAARRVAPVAKGAGVTRLDEAERAATLLIAEIAGALVREQRRFLGISSAATAADQAQFRLHLATVLGRPVFI